MINKINLIILIFFKIYISSTCSTNDALAIIFKKDKELINTHINYCSYINGKHKLINGLNDKICIENKYINSFLYNKVIETRRMRKKIQSFIRKLDKRIISSIISNNLKLQKYPICRGLSSFFNTDIKVNKLVNNFKSKVDEFWDKLTIYYFNIACNINLKKNYSSVFSNLNNNIDNYVGVRLNEEEVRDIFKEYIHIIHSFLVLESFFNCAITIDLKYKFPIFSTYTHIGWKLDNLSTYTYTFFIKFPNNLDWFNDFFEFFEIYKLIIKGKEINILKEIKKRKLEKKVNPENKKFYSDLNIKKDNKIRYTYSISKYTKTKYYDESVKYVINKSVWLNLFSYILISIIFILH